MRLRLAVALLVVGVVWACWAAGGGAAAQDDEKKADAAPSFKSDVMPILSTACANCHTGAKKKAGVDVGSYDTVLKIVKASEPDKSRLVKAVTGTGAKLMPPKKGLSDAQVKVIKEWIAAGAKND